MLGERRSWRAVVGVGWILVAGACSGSTDSNGRAVPGPQGQRESTVLDQRANEALPAEAPPPAERLAAEMPPSAETMLPAEMPPGDNEPPVEMLPSAETMPPAEMLPGENKPPVEMLPPVETQSEGPAESFPPVQPAPPLEPGTLEAGPPSSEPGDAGTELANDASAPVAVPEPPPSEPPVETLPPPVSEPPADAGIPPEVVPDPPVPPVVEEPPPTSFETEVWPIFKASCSSCHGTRRAGGHSVGSPTLATAYADAQRLGFTLIDRLDGGGMPPACSGLPGDPGCIAVSELATIRRWLDTGQAP